MEKMSIGILHKKRSRFLRILSAALKSNSMLHYYKSEVSFMQKHEKIRSIHNESCEIKTVKMDKKGGAK